MTFEQLDDSDWANIVVSRVQNTPVYLISIKVNVASLGRLNRLLFMEQVKRRAAFFLSGFDPRGGRHYYSLYQEEAAKMAAVTGVPTSVSKRKREKKHIMAWQVVRGEGDAQCVTDFRTLDYDDIIRRHWVKTEAGVISQMLQAYWLMLRKGMFNKGWNVYKPLILAMVLWFTLMVAVLLVASTASYQVWQCLSLATVWKSLICGGLFIGIVISGSWLDKFFNHHWLLRGIAFSGLQKQYDDPDYDDRMVYFAEQIIAADKSNEYDEVLVVGHSSGAIWAVEALSRALQLDKELGQRQAEVNLLTLGNCFVLMTATTLDKGFHGHIRYLSQNKQIDWLDLSAKIDNAGSFKIDSALLIPWSEAEPMPKEHLPRMMPARFFKVFSEQQYKKLKQDLLRIHFQYLRASELDGEYDYFRMTGGTDSLREQHLGNQQASNEKQS